MRIIAAADLLTITTELEREDLLQAWQTCFACGAATTPAYWRVAGDSKAAPAHYGLVCPACPDLPELPFQDWAPAENGYDQ